MVGSERIICAFDVLAAYVLFSSPTATHAESFGVVRTVSVTHARSLTFERDEIMYFCICMVMGVHVHYVWVTVTLHGLWVIRLWTGLNQSAMRVVDSGTKKKIVDKRCYDIGHPEKM